MEISSSCHTDAKMVIEGSPSDTLLNITIEEKMESKEGVLASSSATESAIQGIDEQPVVGVVNCDQEENTIFSVNGSVSTKQDLCQDDMFSLAELSAVEDQTEPLLEETTVEEQTEEQTGQLLEEATVEDQTGQLLEEATVEDQTGQLLEEATVEDQKGQVLEEATVEDQTGQVLEEATVEDQKGQLLEEATVEDQTGQVLEEATVEDQTEQLLEEATDCTADILTSVSETLNKPELGSGKVSMIIPFLGEGSEESLEDRHAENTNGQLLEKDKREHVHNAVSLNNSAVNMDTNNDNSLAVTDNRGSGLETQPEKLVETSASEEHLPGNVRFEVAVEPSSDIHDVAHESGKFDNDQLESKAGQEVDSLIEEVPQNDFVKSDTDQLMSRGVDALIEEVPQNDFVKSDTDQVMSRGVDALVEEVTQNDLVESDINQLMGIVVEEVDATFDLQNEAKRNNSDHLTSESCVGVISTEELSNSAMAIDDLKEEENLEQNNSIDVEKINKMGGHGNEHVTELMNVHGLPIEARGSTSKNIGECEHGAKEIDNIPDASATGNEHVGEPSKNIPDLSTEAMNATNAITCSSEHNLKCVENGLVLPVEINDATNDNTNEVDQKESIKLNQVTLSNSLYEATVISVEMNEIHSIPSEIQGKKEEQKSQCIQESEMMQIKEEEESIQNQLERIPSAIKSTLVDDHQSESKESQQILPMSVSTSGTQQETACMDIDIPAQVPSENAMQSTLADDHQSEGKESQQIQLPMSVSSSGTQQETACMDIDIPAQGPSENAMQSENTPKQVGSTKEEIVSVDLGQPCEEVTLLKQAEKALENTPKTTSYDVKLHVGASEFHAEQMEYRDGEQSREIHKENEALKGRKVLKRFDGKMFYGEVIGYDPEPKFFKVLYEDGDEEEFERDELDRILVSDDGPTRKRRATDEYKEGKSSGRKSTKLDEHATPGGQRKNGTPKDKTSGSHHSSSSTKKKKSSVTKSGGKSKSPKTTVRRKKKQKGKSKGTSTKKSVEKEKAASMKKSVEKEKAASTKKSVEKEKAASTKKSVEKEKAESTKKSVEKEKAASTKKSDEKEKAASTKKSPGKKKAASIKKSVEKEKEKAASTKKSVEKEKATKNSQSSQTKGSPKSQTKQGSSKKQVVENSENPHQSVTKKLKYGSAKKKTPKNTKEKSKETPEEDKEVETPQKLMTDKSEVAKPGRKRKSISDIGDGMSTVSSKRAKKEKILNDVESLPARRTRSGMVSTEVQLQGKEEKGESGKTPASGKICGESESGVELVGRKVRKDFGEVSSGEIVKYSKGHYTVKYEDGDTEHLTLEEVVAILFHEEGVSLPNKKGKQHNKSKSAKSPKSVKSHKSGKPNGKKKN